MKTKLLTLLLILGSTSAFADVPPPCPTPEQVKNNPVDFASFTLGSWGAVSSSFGGPFRGVFVSMYDADLDKNTALTLAKKLQQTTTTVVEKKVYWDVLNHQGSYFWACSYDIDPRAVFVGDTMSVFSQDYSANGVLSQSDHTLLEKYARFQGIHAK